MYQYGDYILHKHSWNNTQSIGIFLVYRPEKDTVVLDRDDSVYEVDAKNVRHAGKIEVLNYYNNKIKEFLNQRDAAQKQVEECNVVVRNNQAKIDHINGDLPKVQTKLEALQVAYKLGGNGKDKALMADVEVQIRRIQQNISGCNKSVKGAESNIAKMTRKIEDEQKTINRANEAIKICEAKKIVYLKKIGEYDGLQ